jgi:hypothetical protein
MKSKISERLAEAVDLCAPKNGKYAWIESISDIPISSWKSALNGGQRPTVEMLESFCRSQPELAFYVVTGMRAKKELEHVTVDDIRLDKMDLQLKTLLKKEPIDWSVTELNFALLKLNNGGYYSQDVDPGSLDLAIQANQKGELLNKFLKDEQLRVETEIKSKDANENSVYEDPEADETSTSLKMTLDSISALRSYRDSKK